jgi:hypothetical protein
MYNQSNLSIVAPLDDPHLKLGPAYTSKLVLSKQYEFGTLNPIWQKL